MKTFSYSILSSVCAFTMCFAQSDSDTNDTNAKKNNRKPRQEMQAGYNKSAGIELNDNAWDVGVTGSWLYLQPSQDNMDVGFVATPTDAVELTGPLTPINFDFKYKSGFKVGLNFALGHDDWGMLADYTWFHNTTTTSKTLTDGSVIYPTYGHPLIQGASSLAAGAQAYESASSTWKLKLDFGDLSFYRTFYVGKYLTFKSLGGIRGAWIRQNQSVTYVGNGTAVGLNPNISDTATSYESVKYTSWAVGPRGEVDTVWIFGGGFGFFGNAGADLLYTRYKPRFSEQAYDNVTGDLIGNLSVKDSHIPTVRAHADLEFGLTYGTYFADKRAHLDITAGYGFQVFWDQNMVRKFVTGTDIGVDFIPNGNLYLQGLRLTVNFDF